MKQRTRRGLQNAGVVLLLALCLGWVIWRFWGFASSSFTDNAHVERRIVPVDSRVQGFIDEVRFDDYAFVHKGDTLVVIDDAEYALRLAQARADVQNAATGRQAMNSSISTNRNNVSVSEAAIAEVGVLLENARTDLRRYEALLERGAVTRQQYDAVKANRDALQARYKTMQRQRNSTSLVLGEQRVRLGQNDAAVAIADAALNLAELNLSYTIITAPCDGYCSSRSIQVGQLVQPGQTLVEIVDAGDVWVIANYRERQTASMAVGDSVVITVDAVPGVDFRGVISDMSGATGAAYNRRPDAGAVGNFVKVEQRIPVKIRLAPTNSAENLARLRAGMNVECEVLD